MRSNIGRDPFAITASDNSFGRLSRRAQDLDFFAERRNESGPVLGRDQGAYQKKIIIWSVVILLGLGLLCGRAVYLQIFRGAHYRAVAEGNRIRINDIKATRGIIYDRNLRPLVANIPTFSLRIIPVDLPKLESERSALFEEITKITGQPAGEVAAKFTEKNAYSYQPLVVAENLNPDQAILARILNGRFSCISLQSVDSRLYLTGTSTPSFSHLLGYEGKIEETKLQQYLDLGYSYDDYIGKAGLELSFEKELKGVNGREQVEVDATGQAKELLAFQKPVSGRNLALTIDAGLQQAAENSLAKALRGVNKKKGAVIVLDPNSGAVLTLVSLPAYDNNLFSHGISQADFSDLINNPSQPLFSRAVSGEYPSGSTFKLVVGAAALQEGVITENTSFNSVGGIHVDRWFFPDWKAGGHGRTNIIKALAESVNTFFYIVGGGYEDFTGLGVERIKKYGERFGLNRPLGIDLPQENSGFMPSIEWKENTKNEMWYIGDTYHLAIGQGDLLVTPLQVAAYTAVIANGGKLYRPFLAKNFLDADNEIIGETKPQIISQDFIDLKNIKIIQRGLRQAVLTGSAKGLNGLPLSVAAKTGTAQWSAKLLPHAWITAYAPDENPEIVVTVLVEEGGEGSAVALPVARDVINWWAANRSTK